MAGRYISHRISVAARLDISAVNRPLVNLVAGIRRGCEQLAAAVINHRTCRVNLNR